MVFCVDSFAGYTCSRRDRRNNNCRDLVKLNPASGLGMCLPQGPPNEDFNRLFERNNIDVFTGRNPRSRGYARGLRPLTNQRDPQVIALARVVEAFDRIGDGRMRALKNSRRDIQVVFANSSSSARVSRRIGNQLQITGGRQNSMGTNYSSSCQGKDNHGLIAHEIGHYVAGYNRGEILWGLRQRLRGRKCSITSYANKNWSEHAAEIIAAYITMPQLFARRDTRDCAIAFNYMKEVFGEPNMRMTCNARFQSYRNEGGQTFWESLLPPLPAQR